MTAYVSTSCVLCACLLSIAIVSLVEADTFTVDYENNVFLKDGKPFRYASGSIHYARVPPRLWRDRLRKMRAGGLNVIQTYVPWNFHETSPGDYNFHGERDLMEFLEIAQATDLLVLLRAGPYICGEWEFGGFPSWLLQDKSLKFRSSDPTYLRYVDAWMAELLGHMKPYLYQYGGPIIMVQVENEYGSYGCDHAYIDHLVYSFRHVLGPDIVLYSTDGCSPELIKCGSSSELFTTVDFGVGNDPTGCFDAVRAYQPNGPLVNSEFYTGWLDHWGENMNRVSPVTFANGLDKLLSYENASVNMYMFEGGTNFGFMNGANAGSTYQPSITSYDYDAPLTEAGDTWEKFDLIKQVLSKHIPLPHAHLPPNKPKSAYGSVLMTEYCSLFDAHSVITRIADGVDPVVMEDTDQSFGYILYTLRQKLTPGTEGNTKNLTLQGVHDRAYVYLDHVLQGVLQRKNINQETMSLLVTLRPTSEGLLQIFVENQGRINFGHLLETDSKGILNGVLINGQRLTGWMCSSIPMNGSFPDSMFTPIPQSGVVQAEAAVLFKGELPSFPKGTDANDTFLLLTGWTKGVVFINDFNIGRYWSVMPPQRTLYVPSTILRTDGRPNTVVVFEQDLSPCASRDRDACSITSVDRPVFV